ncbi:hypothetical protein ILUMI_17200 [Ignelater luminosus]|uniref:C2H2-type domain-containing protein n=1 Tax=Ignelater luminosus TaxID=2038154 RepID=A0A8K0G593_IGNLU|nr:hypothetical protein ILUMI_17200 [Ignelater luminosus]
MNEICHINPYGALDYTCPACSRSYKYLRGLRLHIKYECGKEPQFACGFPNCQYRSKQKGKWPSKTYACLDCKKVYKHSGNLNRHIRYECGKGAVYECPFCSYKCQRKDVLKQHIKYAKKHRNVDVDSVIL